jgi:peptide-methionine (S)-S-oxide reductase
MKRCLPVFAALATSLMSSAIVPSMKASELDKKKTGTASVVLAGGCFWGMQGVFEHMKGVTNTVVGYAGGTKETAHYDMVAERNTGQAESIKIIWDPTKVTYGDLRDADSSIARGFLSGGTGASALSRPQPDAGLHSGCGYPAVKRFQG